MRATTDASAGWLAAFRAAAADLRRPDDALPVPPARDRRIWGGGAPHEETIRALRPRAQADLDAPWPVPLAHDYARYFRDGDRETYERAVFARQHRLSRAAVLAAVSLDPIWLDQVADGVTLLCEQSGWCWPAHDDTRAVHGAVVPTVTDPYLDLGAGEVAAQLAWVDHLLGDHLDERLPGLRARIRYEVDRRALIPFTTRRDWHWLGLDGDVHNWSAWIHGNLLVAALRLVDDAPRRAHLVDLIAEGLDRYIASIPPDGAIDEGYSYWWNGACRALEAVDLLASATGVAPESLVTGSLRETIAFPHRVHLGGEWYLNHADGPARPPVNQPWAALHRAARWVGDRDAEAHAAAHRRPGAPVAGEEQGLGRLLRALTDAAWRDAEPGRSPLPRDAWFASTQVLLSRRETGSAAGLTLAAKGGHNGEHHNHNDVGSFVVALGGVPVLVDPGRPTYTAQTFGPRRYEIWTMQSLWHNLPEIGGSAQLPGRGHAARDVAVALGDVESGITLDLAGAYSCAGLRHWWREARLERPTGRIVITDTWEFDPPGPPGPTTIHLLAAGAVRVGEGRAEIVALDAAGVALLTWTPADAPVTVTARELDDPMLRDVWSDAVEGGDVRGNQLTRLDIVVTAWMPTGSFVLTVEECR